MGHFFSTLFDGLSLDNIIIYLLAVRGVLAGASLPSLPKLPPSLQKGKGK